MQQSLGRSSLASLPARHSLRQETLSYSGARAEKACTNTSQFNRITVRRAFAKVYEIHTTSPI